MPPKSKSSPLVETIPAGIELRVTTWENDADHYRVTTHQGLSLPEARFLSDLAWSFRRDEGPDYPGLGNEEHEESALRALIERTLLRHPDLPPAFRESWESAKYPAEFLYDWLLGRPVGYDYGFCRVVERVEAFEIPATIVIERSRLPDSALDAPEPPPVPARAPRPL